MKGLLISTLAAAALAGACTTTPTMDVSERERLARDCEARGGVLAPSGQNSQHEALNYTCRTQRASRVGQ